MYLLWTKHLDNQEDKSKFIDHLRGQKELFGVIINIVDSLDRAADSEDTSHSQYDKPNWDYRQADRNGYRRCLKQMKSLFNLDQQK